MNYYEHMQCVFVKFVLKLLIISGCFDLIVKLAKDAFKELVESSLCKYESDCHPMKMCIVQDKLNPELFVDVPR